MISKRYVKDDSRILCKAESAIENTAFLIVLALFLVLANFVEAENWWGVLRTLGCLAPVLGVIALVEVDGRIRYRLYLKYGGYGFQEDKK